MFQLPLDSADAARRNLHSLFLLRNLLIVAELLIILVTLFGVGVPLETDPLMGIIAMTVALNCLTWFRLQHERPVTEWELFGHLCLDAVGITGLLYFTGGATNPMAWFLLLPLIITATVLPQQFTWLMMLLTCGCYTLLIFHFHPLPPLPVMEVKDTRLLPPEEIEGRRFELHAFGTWVGFVFSAGLVAYFVVEMANTLRERERRLAEIREQALRDEQVVALGTLAAGAAHEMGTPLGTMAILLQELLEDYDRPEDRSLRQRLLIFKDQIERCKNALAVMSASAGQSRAEGGHREQVRRYLEYLVGQWRQQRPGARLILQLEGGPEEAALLAEQTLTHALLNILNNAAEVSTEPVLLQARWSHAWLDLAIIDRGPGITPDLREALGRRPVASKKRGLGVGLFLAYATVERLGGEIVMEPMPDQGTCTRIRLPLLTPDEEGSHD